MTFSASLATIGATRSVEGRLGGEVAPGPSSRRRLTIGGAAEQRRVLWRQLGANPEATLEKHREFHGSKSGA